MNELTVNTVQGIGDLVWVYRKLAPLCTKLNFNVNCISLDTIQKRAEPFLSTLPKCGTVTYQVVGESVYTELAHKLHVLPPTGATFDYAVNAWLEKGIHLDSIDASPVQWDLGIQYDQNHFKHQGEYLLVYISGCSHGAGYYQMSDPDWAQLIRSVMAEKKLNKVFLIGASFDLDKLNAVWGKLNAHGICAKVILPSILDTMGMIKNASYFIAYQSGLCMLSEEVGTPTFMVWFPYLAPMTSAWIRRENLIKGLFKHGFFGQSVNAMLETIKRGGN